MKNLVNGFPKQLKEAIAIGQNYHFKTAPKAFSNVVVTGLGGSGIGGSIVQNFVFGTLAVPFLVNKEYSLPEFVDNHSLVIVCSYSGNTEETLESLHKAHEDGATIVCITSGGKVAAFAKEHGYDCILVPGGMPPRSCLGYSVVQQLFVLSHFGLIKDTFVAELTHSAISLEENGAEIRAYADTLANEIAGKLPIIYSAGNYEGVAIRFRQQLNENSKMLCWHAVIPEMNHNELVGWRDSAQDKVVILLRNADDYTRVQTRMEINKKVISQYTGNIIEIYSKGNCYWEKAMYLIHLTDWVSVILADIRNLDATEVKVIDFLKGELAKM